MTTPDKKTKRERREKKEERRRYCVISFSVWARSEERERVRERVKEKRRKESIVLLSGSSGLRPTVRTSSKGAKEKRKIETREERPLLTCRGNKGVVHTKSKFCQQYLTLVLFKTCTTSWEFMRKLEMPDSFTVLLNQIFSMNQLILYTKPI